MNALQAPWLLLRDSVAAFVDDDVPSLGAALAYYTLFSIAPLLLIVLAWPGPFLASRRRAAGSSASCAA